MKLTQRDPNQITQAEHDESLNASRVTIVGGDFGLAQAVKDGLKDIKFDQQPGTITEYKQPMIIEKEVIVKQIQTVQIPTIVKEYERFEVPVIVKEQQEIKIIEVPKVIFEPKIIEIEKIVIVKEIANMDKMFKLFLLGQTISTLIYLFGLYHK